MGGIETIKSKLTAFRQHTADRRLFGAREHRYRFHATLPEATLAAVEKRHELRLPDDYRAFLADVGNGGAGPFYGVLPLDTPAQEERLSRPFPHHGAWNDLADPGYLDDRHTDGAIALSHVGCGYFCLLVVRSDDPAQRGTVWVDLREAELGLLPTHPSFAAWYEAWLDGPGLPTPAPPDACNAPRALLAYLDGAVEESAVRAALATIEDQGIATTTQHGSRYFDAGDCVSPCPSCQHFFDGYIARKLLRPGQIKPGIQPKGHR